MSAVARLASRAGLAAFYGAFLIFWAVCVGGALYMVIQANQDSTPNYKACGNPDGTLKEVPGCGEGTR